jgi:hypothetical protein
MRIGVSGFGRIAAKLEAGRWYLEAGNVERLPKTRLCGQKSCVRETLGARPLSIRLHVRHD